MYRAAFLYHVYALSVFVALKVEATCRLNTEVKMWPYEKVLGHRLTAILETLITRNALECGMMCTGHSECVMFNVKKLSDSESQCELLSAVGSYSLTVDADFVHYRLKIPGRAWDSTNYPADCSDYYKAGVSEDGVYPVFLNNAIHHVYCELCNDDGWTRIQRRQDGTVSFDRNWADYALGFGDPTGDLWLGNDVIHALTNQASYEMKVDLVLFTGQYYYAQYSSFSLDDAASLYTLHVSGYSGTSGDGFSYNTDSLLIHDGNAFSTPDSDNDNVPGSNAAADLLSGYWYNDIYSSNLNGKYWDDASTCTTPSIYGSGACIAWDPLGVAIREVTMKVRPV